jgi:fumarate reductase subunit C
MKKIHGWFIIFVAYAFALFAVAILISYLQNFINILNANPYVIMIFVCTLALNLMGAYVIHRSED